MGDGGLEGPESAFRSPHHPISPTPQHPIKQTPGVTTGNAADDAIARRGWLLGHFVPGMEHPLQSSDVEVQWAVFQGGEQRAEWGYNAQAHTLAILVRGRFHLWFPEGEVTLRQEGDYVLWEPGVSHFWRAEGPTVVVTVRWPSLPGDSRPMDEGDGVQR